MTDRPQEVADLLGHVASALPGGGEDRPGQLAMAQEVDRAIAEHRHLVVQAGTGTGKSLGYLVPVLRSGITAVIATATKALQDQLATNDLPFLTAQLGHERPFSFAVLKGRSNYVCRQKVAEMTSPLVATADDDIIEEPVIAVAATLFPDELDSGNGDGGAGARHNRPSPPRETGREARLLPDPDGLGGQAQRIIAWSDTVQSGDRAELDFEPHPRVWAMLSVNARECPGAFRCPSGGNCFAEKARDRAAAADVVVVNTHLYATHVKSGGTVLPDHQVVVFDEAHAVEDIMTAGLGVELAAGRFRALAQSARGLLPADEGGLVDGLVETADHLDAVLQPLGGHRVLGPDEPDEGRGARHAPDMAGASEELRHLLGLARGRIAAVIGALVRAGAGDGGATDSADGPAANGPGSAGARAMLAAGHIADDLDVVIHVDDDQVAWVEASGPSGRVRTLRVAPIDVGPVLARDLWPEVTAVLTSATVPPLLETQLGLPAAQTDRVDVGSPFPFERNALLYCAARLPDPRRAGAEAAQHAELAELVRAAGGRTLALFTSWRAMQAAADALGPVLPYRVMTQNELPKLRLIEAFSADESTCLFATMSFWQGVDVPGPTLSLVVMDKLPFARPDDPLIGARRRRAGDDAFRLVDVPRAATLLAQGAGRLIRSTTDTGVVAVLDPRLATSGYGATLRRSLPPMRFTTRRDEVVAFLEAIAAARGAAQQSAQ